MVDENWQRAGVFTVAGRFGDDAHKGGEFEAFLGRVDNALLAEARDKPGERNKPLVGAYFAIQDPQPPRDVLDLYKQISRRFKLATKLLPTAYPTSDDASGRRSRGPRSSAGPP